MTNPQHPPYAHLRELVKDCLSKHMYDSAAFFADKLVTLSGHAPADVWLLAQARAISARHLRSQHLAYLCTHKSVPSQSNIPSTTPTQAFYVNKQYHRCLLLLKQSDLVDQDVRCRYLAARCLIACEEWDECLQLLGEDGDNDAMMTEKTTVRMTLVDGSRWPSCHVFFLHTHQLASPHTLFAWPTSTLQTNPTYRP